VLVVFAVAFLVRGGILASGMVPAAWIERETGSTPPAGWILLLFPWAEADHGIGRAEAT
jgi:hypothetical protein